MFNFKSETIFIQFFENKVIIRHPEKDVTIERINHSIFQ